MPGIVSDPGVLSLLLFHHCSLLFVLSVPTKNCMDQITALSTSIFPFHGMHKNTHIHRDHDADIHQGGVSFLWLMRPGMMGVRHVM